MSPTSEEERLCKELRIARSQLATSKLERATLEDMADAAAELRERYQAQRDKAMRERDAAQARYYMAEEMQRRELSESLHDSAGQFITAIRQYAYLIKKQSDALAEDDAAAQRIAEYAQHIIDHSSSLTDATRTVLNEQWPDSLEREGLHAAIEDQIDFWRASAPGMTLRSHLERIPEFDGAIFVFRIAQEWFNNVQRHAQAGEMAVTLECSERDGKAKFARLRCEDNGVGFDPESVHGRGLSGIHERARILGATLSVESAPGQGSTLTLDFPIP